MKKIDWDEFKKTSDYQHLSQNGKNAIAQLSLDGITISEESLADFILLDKGAISTDDLIAKAIKRATTQDVKREN